MLLFYLILVCFMYVTNKAGHFFADIIIRSKTKKKDNQQK